MEILKIEKYFVVYQRQGNDANGNPIFIINFFEMLESGYYFNLNFKIDRKKDKYGNIKITSYSINDTVKQLINQIK